MAIIKPDLTRVWASGAPGANVVDPDVTTPGKFDAGWQAEVPPFEHFNFLQNFFTQGLAYLNEQGVPEWDTDTVYPVGAIVKGTDGTLYGAIAEQSGNDPVSDNGTNWKTGASLILVQNGNTVEEEFTSRSRKNLIINGNFGIWGRGTSQTTSNYASDDRWINDHVGSTKTHTRQSFTVGQTDVDGNPTFFSRTLVTSVAGASNYVLKQQRIEDVRKGSGRQVTISFYAKSDAARNMAIEIIQNFGSGGSPSGQVSNIGSQLLALTTSWKKFEITVAIPSISGKVLGTDQNNYLALNLWFEAGSNLSGRTANLGQQSGTFDIAQVQLEIGDNATSFEHRFFSEELALCQRYFTLISSLVIQANPVGGNPLVCQQSLPTTMRINPSTSFLPNTGTGHAVSATSSVVRLAVIPNGVGFGSADQIKLDAEL